MRLDKKFRSSIKYFSKINFILRKRDKKQKNINPIFSKESKTDISEIIAAGKEISAFLLPKLWRSGKPASSAGKLGRLGNELEKLGIEKCFEKKSVFF